MKEQDVLESTEKASKSCLPALQGNKNGLQNISLSFAEKAIDAIMLNRHLKDKVGGYANIESFILAIVLKGKSIQKSALAKSWTVEACLFLPSIKTYELSKSEDQKGFTDEMAAKVFADEIQGIGDFLEVSIPSNESLEELSWNLYDNYYHWSFMDLLMCCQKIKSLEYKTEYQHISSRGITIEFILEWFEKYDNERGYKEAQVLSQDRQIAKSEFYQDRTSFEKSESTLDLDIILNDILIKRNSKVLKRSILKTLQEEHKQKIKSTSKYIQLYDEIYFLLSLCDDDHNKIDAACKTMIASKMKEWRIEFALIDQKETEQINEFGEKEITKDRFLVQDGKTYRVKSITLDKFYNQKASSLKHKIVKDIESTYMSDIVSIAFSIKNPESNAGDVSFSTKKVIQNIQKMYFDYVNDSIDKREFPFSKEKYFFAKANIFAFKYADYKYSNFIIKKHFEDGNEA